MRKTGQVIAVTATKQTISIGAPDGLYTLCNDDSANPLFYRGNDAGAFAGADAAAMYVLGASRLLAGEKVTIKGGSYNFACTTGLTASCRVLYGAIAFQPIAGSVTEASAAAAKLDLDAMKAVAAPVNATQGAAATNASGAYTDAMPASAAIPANAVALRFSITGDWAHVAIAAAQPTTDTGVAYPVNGVYQIPVPTALSGAAPTGHLWLQKINGGNTVTIRFTWLLSA